MSLLTASLLVMRPSRCPVTVVISPLMAAAARRG